MPLKIKYLEKNEDVYDITVEGNSNFVANRIVVHNCSEIILPSDKERTPVCCLSSLNLEYWDEWKDDYQFYLDVCEMLDNVLDVFIKNAPKEVERAVYSASRERSIGIGALGFHALLQAKNIPFESAMASSINMNIFKRYKKYVDQANLELGARRGEAPDAKGTGRRFSNTLAIAPNASSSMIMGNTSPSIEPYRANAYRQDTMSGSFLNKNKHLDKIIKERCKDVEKTWNDIVVSKGSVQHVDFLSDYEKDVFKTATEIDQSWVVHHAAVRQEYIDQAQSLNLFFPADADIIYLHHVHFNAWKQKVKTLYYCRSEKIYHGDSITKQIERIRLDDDQCIACEG
jgi:ribonucleoside-diphosphate reductase alpha chain